MAQNFAGKTALITGGGSGIGRAAACRFAEAGANVVISDIDDDGARETLSLIADTSGEAAYVRTDMSSATEIEALVGETVSRFGGLDCAFNNAGIQGELCPTAECSEDNWDAITGVNLKGVWLSMKYEILAMLNSGGGAIVNNASNFGLVGSNGMPAYSASKHGVVGLTKTASVEYAAQGIRVNAVCPGPVNTPLVEAIVARQPEIIDAINEREPIGRMGQPNEIASAVLWLCSDEASFTVGAVLSVDGGYVAQ